MSDKKPCYKCTDRYRACQDTCRKPEYIAWRELINKHHAYEQRKREEAESIHDSIRRGGRYGSYPNSKLKG